jgi:hypothetical protein
MLHEALIENELLLIFTYEVIVKTHQSLNKDKRNIAYLGLYIRHNQIYLNAQVIKEPFYLKLKITMEQVRRSHAVVSCREPHIL